MKTLGNIKLIELMPIFLRSDPFIISACDVLTPYINELDVEIRQKLILNQIDYLDAAELDNLAIDRRITWYNTADSLIVKRNVIKKALEIQAYAGTTWAIEEAAKTVFASGRVEEWHQYGGEANHFKVFTSNAQANAEMSARFLQIINKLKSSTAVLDAIIIELASALNIKVGMYTHIGEVIYLRQVT